MLALCTPAASTHCYCTRVANQFSFYASSKRQFVVSLPRWTAADVLADGGSGLQSWYLHPASADIFHLGRSVNEEKVTHERVCLSVKVTFRFGWFWSLRKNGGEE